MVTEFSILYPSPHSLSTHDLQKMKKKVIKGNRECKNGGKRLTKEEKKWLTMHKIKAVL